MGGNDGDYRLSVEEEDLRKLAERYPEGDARDIAYFRHFLTLAQKGKVRLLAGGLEAVTSEMQSGNNTYLVVMDPLRE